MTGTVLKAGEVAIKKSVLDELKKDSIKLEYLIGYGVDNWSEYGEAMSAYYSEQGED